MKKATSTLIVLLFISLFSGRLYSQDFIKAGVFGASKAEFIHDYSIDNNEDLIICGTFQNTVDFNMANDQEALLTAISNYDMYIAKYDIMGNYKWAININGNPSKTYYVYSITTDQSNNIYITGFADSWIDLDPSNEEAIVNQEENRVFFISKYNSSGEYSWGHAMGINKDISIVGWDVAIDTAGDLYVCGTFGETVDFDPSGSTYNLIAERSGNFFLAKYSNSGGFIWAKMLGHPSGYGNPGRIQIDSENNVYMGGYFSGTFDMDPSDEVYTINSAGQSDGFLSKYDQNGNFVWAFSIGSVDSDYIRNLRYLNGKIYTVGAWSDTVDFDPSENTFELISLEDETSGFMSVYGTDGNFQSAIGIKGFMMEYQGSGSEILDIDIDSENNSYLIGYFSGKVDFDPSDDIAELTSTGGESDFDMFLTKYNPDNNYLWGINVGGQSQERGFHVKVNGNENVIALGYYDGHCDFDPSAGERWIYNRGGHDVFMAWYSLSPNTFINNPFDVEIQSTIYPNPFSTSTTIEYYLQHAATVQITICNQLGEQVDIIHENQFSGKQQVVWNAERLPAGIYYFNLQAGEQSTWGKMVVLR